MIAKLLEDLLGTDLRDRFVREGLRDGGLPDGVGQLVAAQKAAIA